MQKLDVINIMLATVGMRPVTSLIGTHRLLPGALACLEEANRSVQAKAWWFNKETATLQPATDGFIYLPNDCVKVLTKDRNLIKRGDRLYDRDAGTFTFSSSVTLFMCREVPFEDLPDVAATYISDTAILAFQRTYDGDSQKTTDLRRTLAESRVEINAEETRHNKVNWLDNNWRLQLLKSRTNRIRRY